MVRLTRQLALEERGEAPDGAGGRSGAWRTLGRHWARIEPRTGRLERGEGGPRSRVPVKITLRATPHGAPSRPRPGQRFREGERIFLIRAVFEQDPAAMYLTCFADEEAAA